MPADLSPAIIFYTLFGLLLLVLSTGLWQPPSWKRLEPQRRTILRFGCGIGCGLLLVNLASRFLGY